MSEIKIQKISITELAADAVVNAANTGLWEGGGVCGYIFRDAGSREMTEACNKIGHCEEGSAVITPGFKLPAKYVIHAVGPRWSGGNNNEPKLLYSAYMQSLLLAKENNLHSIGFPLISAGIFGYPVDQAWKKAIQACNDFIKTYPDYKMDIVFAVLDDKILSIGKETLKEIVGNMTAVHKNKEMGACFVQSEVLQRAFRWCQKYEVLFRVLYEDEELRAHLQEYNVYQPPQGHRGIYKILHDCMEQAYDSGIVIANYRQVIEEGNLSEKYLARPTAEWVEGLSAEQNLACIAWHFRRDHFSEGSWINDSVANGYMMILVDGFTKK